MPYRGSGPSTLAVYLSYSIREGRPAPWTTTTCFARLDFLENLLPQSRHWAGEEGRAAVWQATWCLRRLSPLVKALPHVSQVKVGGRCSELCRRKIFLLENVL